MPSDSPNIRLKVLSIVGDQPPHRLQPVALPDGIHLRWTCLQPRERGLRATFPWNGFYLLRRISPVQQYICLAPDLSQQPLGQQVSPNFYAPSAQVSGNDPLFFTDEFFPRGSAEIAFDDRAPLEIRPTESARAVRITVGMRTSDMTCVDFTQMSSGTGQNPRVENGVRFEVFLGGSPVPNTRIRELGGPNGLDCGDSVDITLPCASGFVAFLATSRSGPKTAFAYDIDGALVAQATLPGVDPLEIVELAGADIVRINFKTPQDEVVIHWFCHHCGPVRPTSLTATAFDGEFSVDEAIGSAWPSGQVTVHLQGDAIDRVRLSVDGPAALIDFCVVPAAQGEQLDWEAVPNAPAPFCLPVDSPG